jgi:GT2 family glycosyltransferase
MTVSVVIVTWNSRDTIVGCVRSLLDHTSTAELDILVVDNASSDGTAALVRGELPQARLIENDENVGFARACNQGMAASQGDPILLLNPDVHVEDDVVGRAAGELARRPEIGALGVELRLPDGRRNHTAYRRLSVRLSLLDRLWISRLLPAERRAAMLLGGYWEEVRDVEVDWLAAAFVLLHRRTFEETGGFDERFFMYGEDSEWGMRMRRRGIRILYAPRLGVVHHAGAVSSHQAWSEPERLERSYRGGLISYARAYGARRATLYRFAELLGATVRWGVYSVAARARRDDYLAHQAQWYGWLARFYLRHRVPRIDATEML